MNEKYDMFSKEELHEISRRATSMASVKGINPDWAKTYRKIADAVDELDDRIDKSTMYEHPERMEGCLVITKTEHPL